MGESLDNLGFGHDLVIKPKTQVTTEGIDKLDCTQVQNFQVLF